MFSLLFLVRVWNMGSCLPCSSFLKAFGILFRVRSIHLQFKIQESRSSHTNLLGTFLSSFPFSISPTHLISRISLSWSSCQDTGFQLHILLHTFHAYAFPHGQGREWEEKNTRGFSPLPHRSPFYLLGQKIESFSGSCLKDKLPLSIELFDLFVLTLPF